MLKARRWSLLPFLILFAACNDSPVGVRVQGSYTIDVSGDGVAESLQGTAFYGTDTSEGGQQYFGILLADSDETNANEIDPNDGIFGAFIRQGNEIVSTGTYPIADAGTSGLDSGDLFFVLTTQDDGYIYVSTGGSLTVTEVLGDALEGTFTVPGLRVQEGSQTVTAVTISGSFLAAAPNSPGAGFIDPSDFGVFFGSPVF